MAGIFGLFDYTKPGKGVDKDAPEKHPFFLFFELLWRKKGQLLLQNIIYFIALIPIITFVYANWFGLFSEWLANAGEEVHAPILQGLLLGTAVRFPSWLQIGLLAVSAILYGPVSCGFAYMLRNFVRQEKAWNTDFFDKFKQNFRQGLALGLVDLAVLYLLVFNISFPAVEGSETLFTVVRYLSILFLLIFLFMRNYLFVMAVTFKLKVRQIIKNALIFSIVGLWRNLLALLINVVLVVLVVFLFELVELALVPLLLFSLTGFVTMFLCYPVVKKHMIDPLTAQAASETAETPETSDTPDTPKSGTGDALKPSPSQL